MIVYSNPSLPIGSVAVGSLITVGGIRDDPSNNVANYDDDELYDLRPFLFVGDTLFSALHGPRRGRHEMRGTLRRWDCQLRSAMEQVAAV